LILADQTIGEDQKQALVRIYLSFRRDYEDEHGSPITDDESSLPPADDPVPPPPEPPAHAATA
jgi:hypothetical protein